MKVIFNEDESGSRDRQLRSESRDCRKAEGHVTSLERSETDISRPDPISFFVVKLKIRKCS